MAPSSDRKGARVRLVVIHTAEGSRTKESMGAYFNSGVAASSHVGIDPAGIMQYVPYDRAAWTLRGGNAVSDNAELCAFAQMTRAQWLTNYTITFYHVALKRNVTVDNPLMQCNRAADWIRFRCHERGIPIVKLSPADVRAGKAGVIGHVDWTKGMNDGSHTDPGPNFPWDYVIARANGGTPPAPKPEGLFVTLKPEQEDLIFRGVRDIYGTVDRREAKLDMILAKVTGMEDDKTEIVNAILSAMTAQSTEAVDVDALAGKLIPALGPELAEALGRRLMGDNS